MKGQLLSKYNAMAVPAKAALWYMICSILQKGIALITTPIFTRILSAEDYGLYTVYLSWSDMFIVFISLRLEFSVFNKGMSKYKENRDGYVGSMQIITTITSVLFLILYFLFRDQFNSLTELSTIIMIMILLKCAVFPSFDFWMLRERYEYRYIPFVSVTLALTLLNSVLGLIAVLLFSESGGIARITTDFAVYFVIGVVLYIINFKKGLKKAKYGYAKFALLFNIPLIPHYIATYILNQMDRIMIQKMVGVVQAGIYSVAFCAGMMMNIVSTSLINAITPWYYGKLEEGRFEDVKSKFPLLLFLIGVVILIFLLFAPEAMMLLAPAEYWESIYVIPPIACSIIFSVMYSFFTIPEFFYDANKFSMFASGLAAIFNLVSNFVFISMFGYLAAGFTTMGCHMIMAICHYIYAKKVMKKQGVDFFDKKHIALVYVLVICIIPITCFLYDYPYLRYGLALLSMIGLVLFRQTIVENFKKIRTNS